MPHFGSINRTMPQETTFWFPGRRVTFKLLDGGLPLDFLDAGAATFAFRVLAADSDPPVSNRCLSHERLSSRITSMMLSFLISVALTPNTRHARSFAARIVHGSFVSVVKMACDAGDHRVWPA